MARPSLDSDPQYAEYKARLEPLKGIVEKAKEDAARDVERAKQRVEAEMLAIIREAIEANYSQYAVGKLTGKTRSEDQKRLIERAMGADWVPNAGRDAPGVFDVGGWLFGPAGAAGTNEHGTHTPFVAPDGTRYTVAYGDDNKCHWYFADGTRLTYDQCDALLTFEVEEFARANAL